MGMAPIHRNSKNQKAWLATFIGYFHCSRKGAQRAARTSLSGLSCRFLLPLILERWNMWNVWNKFFG
jgi:hypothetical protein